MSIRLQVILLVLLIFILIGMVTQIKRKKLDLKYTLSWFALIIALIVLTCFPKLLIVIADFLGITTPINMIFFW